VTKSAADFVTLNPFEVKAEADNSYGALNSNSLTQFNTALDRTPVSADIFTAEFMRDIAVTSVEEMLNGYGAGAGTVMSNPDSDALSQQPGDRVGNQTIGIRGTGGGAIRRDGFAATGAANNFGSTAVGITSTFDVERADVVRGPQGLLTGRAARAAPSTPSPSAPISTSGAAPFLGESTSTAPSRASSTTTRAGSGSPSGSPCWRTTSGTGGSSSDTRHAASTDRSR
jgi:hypothetical protein